MHNVTILMCVHLCVCGGGGGGGGVTVYPVLSCRCGTPC